MLVWIIIANTRKSQYKKQGCYLIGRYILYILTAITNYYLVMFLWGVSAGFSNYIPVIAVFGSLSIFTIATPALAIKFKIGLIIGLISGLAILPFNISYLVAIIKDKDSHNFISLLTMIPAILNIVTIFFIVIGLRKENKIINFTFKMLLVIMPLVIFIIYLISIWKYSPWQWFIINDNK